MAVVGAPDRCPHCALPLRGPVAAELWQLDRALAGLRAREAELLVRRGRLLDLLRSERGHPAGSDPGVRPAPAGTGPQPAPAEPPAPGQPVPPVPGQQVPPVPARPGFSVPAMPGPPVPARPGFSVPAMPGLPVPGQQGSPMPEWPGPPVPGQPGRPAASPRRDFSPKAVQNLLLVLGGLLLAVAAIVFTVVSWGQIGIGGRAAILAGITVLTLAVPKLLVKRELVATAETIAVLGVALLFLDGYAARRVGLAGADRIAGLDYAALLIALIALVVAGYSRLLPLRLPLPIAIVLAQFPLPLLALSETDLWFTAALAATAAADAAFIVFGHRRDKPATVPGDEGPAGSAVPGDGDLNGPVTVPGDEGPAGSATVPEGAGPGRGAGVRMTVGRCFDVVWTLGVGHGSLNTALGLMDSARADDLFTASIKGVLLVVLAVIGVAVAPRTAPGRLRALTAGAAFALTAGLAAPVWPLLPAGWWAVPHTVAALAVAVAALRLPGLNDPRVRSAGAACAATLAALTALPFVPAVASTLLTPFNRLDGVWSGVNGAAGDRWIAPFPEGVVVLGLLAVASAAMARRGHASLRPVALAAGTVTVAVAPVASGWSHAADLAVLLALAVTLVACLTLARRPWWAGAFTMAAGSVAALAVATALAERATTYAALAVLLAACGLAVFTARVPWAAAAALAMAVLSATGLIWAVSVGTGWQPVREGLSLALAVGALPAGLLALRRWSVAAGVSVSDGVAGGSAGVSVSDGVAGGSAGVSAPHGVAGGSAAGPVADGPVAGGPAVEAVDGPAVDGATVDEAVVDGPAVDGADDPRRVTGLVLGSVLAALALLPMHAVLAEILGFYRPLARPWTPLHVSGGRHPILIVITVLVAASAVPLSWQVAGRKGVLRAGAVAWPVALTALPVSVGLPYGLEVGLFVAGIGPLAWMAARSRTDWAWGGATALWTASIALSWALMSRPATLVVLPVTAVIAGVTAFHGRAKAVRVAGAALATSLAGGEALAAGMALEWPVRHAAFGVLAVACLAAAVAGRFRTAVFAIGAETAGYALAAVGLVLGAADLPLAALACAVAGVLMAGTALRPDRRWAGYVGTGFLLVASWLRLLASDITVIEAYTVPFSLVLLAFGWWRSRSRETSSWVAYGSGLASSLLPSMIAMLAGAGWVRPLLLGAVSLAVLLAGARLRLQAPALLGGLTLAAVALHELAPWIAQVVVMVPRWVPMAAGGLLLVVVGATYEARLGDVRRLRAAVGRMR
ncbi:SCO7613 C-terminal domain-containing membrane protein [Streptosporangium roseum]|uniref:SCO7613 C-terminal domain-containing membrane protein n=1 Tax=Streptosporangium roseum TaxID=2001 RepID=UPI0033251E72